MSEDLVAWLHVLDAGSDGLHHAGSVAAQDHRVLVRHHPGEKSTGDSVVDRVQGGRLDPNQDGALGDDWDGHVTDLGRRSSGRDVQCAHGRAPCLSGLSRARLTSTVKSMIDLRALKHASDDPAIHFSR